MPLVLWVVFFFLPSSAFADEDQKVIIDEAFIELHTGPGRGFPVFYIVEKGQLVSLIKKKTQWYKVRSVKGHEGWVHEKRIQKTLYEDGEKFSEDESDKDDYTGRSFELGVLGGDFGGATSLTLYAGWNFTENLSAEIAVAQALGNVSDLRYANISLLHQPFPEWRYTPFFKIGAGVIQTIPSVTLIQSEDRVDESVNVGLGLKVYVSQQFMLRTEYTRYTILTSRNNNDEVEEWKLGFSVFF